MIDLDLDTPPSRTRVVVAMSGGVDSSATAALLVEAGYQVIGITLRLYDHGRAVGRPGACCAGADIHDARRVAERLGIAHYVLDFEERFRRAVIDDFADAYVRGETPSPCIRCNETVKFRDLLATAKDLDAGALVTGHYARWRRGANGAELWRGADPARDQSYFLFSVGRERLDFVRFPLGDLDKRTVRAHAQRLGLSVAAKPDSQDICFVPDGCYADLVARLRPEAARPGEIVDDRGQVLGRHDGLIRYTVGQRRGLGIGGGDPLYVLRLEPDTNRVVVGPQAALGRASVDLRAVTWLDPKPNAPRRAMVKLRSTQPPVPATVIADGEGARVELDRPFLGVAPGQACVFYDQDRVLGGGWISRPTAAEARDEDALAVSA